MTRRSTTLVERRSTRNWTVPRKWKEKKSKPTQQAWGIGVRNRIPTSWQDGRRNCVYGKDVANNVKTDGTDVGSETALCAVGLTFAGVKVVGAAPRMGKTDCRWPYFMGLVAKQVSDKPNNGLLNF